MTPEQKLLLILSVPLLLFGALCVLVNLRIVLGWWLWRERASLAPIFGGLALALGVLLMPLLPWPWRWWLALAALVVDISIPALLLVFICWAIPPLRRRTLDRWQERQAPRQDSRDQAT